MLVIDGYNLTFARKARGLARSSRVELASARESLLDLLSDYRARHPEQILVVFDGDRSDDPGPRRSHRPGIEVLFSPPKVDADTVIKGYVGQARRPAELRVVTSDREVAAAARAAGASPIDSHAFLEHVRALLEPGAGRAPKETEEADLKAEGLPPGETERWLEAFDLDGDGEVRLTEEEPPPWKD